MATAQRHCYCRRRVSYKQMVSDIAENLGSEDVQKLVFLHDLPSEYSRKSALVALRLLETRGEFSESQTERLVTLLKEINRFDLIDRYLSQYTYRSDHFACENTATRGASVPVPIPTITHPPIHHTQPSPSPDPHPPKHPSHTTTPKSHDASHGIAKSHDASHDITESHDASHDVTKSHDPDRLGSTRLQPAEKTELRNLLAQYVPHDVIRRSKIYEKLSFLRSKCSFKSVDSLVDSQVMKDGGYGKHRSRSVPKISGSHLKKSHAMTSSDQVLVYRGGGSKSEDDSSDLEWVVLEAYDSGTCSSSGSSMDVSAGTLDFDISIGDLTTTDKSKKKKVKKFDSCKERRYFTWHVKRSEFMIPLFKHTSKTFERRLKLCLGPHDHCLPIVFKLYPNGVGSDENIYSSLRIVLPSASQMVPPGTTLVFSISVRDLRTADVIASRHMEVGLEREEYLLEQFLAHEVIKSSEARHFEIRIMTKVNASSRGWVEIQS